MKNRTTLFLASLAAVTGSALILAATDETNKANQSNRGPRTAVLAPETASEARDGVNTKAAPAPAKTGDTKKEVKSAKLSFGLDDVVKMVQSGVAPDVILTYIDNSTVAYYATAEDVVQLHEGGVPSQITAALIRHGGKLRAQQAQAAREMQTAVAPPATPNYSSAYSYAEQPAQPTYVTYNYSDPQYAYSGYPSCYAYPRYSYFTYPSFYFSYSSPIYFRHHYPYRYNHFYARPIYSGIRVGSNSGRFNHGPSGIHVRGRL